MSFGSGAQNPGGGPQFPFGGFGDNREPAGPNDTGGGGGTGPNPDKPCWKRDCINRKLVVMNLSWLALETSYLGIYNETEGGTGHSESACTLAADSALWNMEGDWTSVEGYTGGFGDQYRVIYPADPWQLSRYQEEHGRIMERCNFDYQWNCSKSSSYQEFTPAPKQDCCPRIEGAWDSNAGGICMKCTPNFPWLTGTIRRDVLHTFPNAYEDNQTGEIVYDDDDESAKLVKISVTQMCNGEYKQIQYGKMPGPGPDNCPDERVSGAIHMRTQSHFPSYSYGDFEGMGGMTAEGDIGTTVKVTYHPCAGVDGIENCEPSDWNYYIATDGAGAWFPPGTGHQPPFPPDFNNIMDAGQAFELYKDLCIDSLPCFVTSFSLGSPGQNPHCWDLKVSSKLSEIQPYINGSECYLTGCLAMESITAYPTVESCCIDAWLAAGRR